MKYRSIKFKNFKGYSTWGPIPFTLRKLNDGNLHGKYARPVHTILYGENGAGKSSVLEALTLPSLMHKMTHLRDAQRKPNEPLTEIKIEIDARTPVEEECDAKGGVDIMKSPFVGEVRFCAEDLVSAQIIRTLTEGLFLSLQQADAQWFYEGEKEELLRRLVSLARANHPINPATSNWNDLYRLNRMTERSKRLKDGQDVTDLGTCMYINTDLNEMGLGLHVLESPKNLARDLGKVLHCRLPATELSGTETGSVRRIKDISKLFKHIFDSRWNKKKPSQTKLLYRGPARINCEANGSAKVKFIGSDRGTARDAEFVSSGENEALLLLCALIGCEIKNSVVLLDEPELHLSWSVIDKFYSVLSYLAHDRKGEPICEDTQFIIATHAPMTPFHAFTYNPGVLVLAFKVG